MVNIFWTGLDICSREITTYEAIRFIDNTKHMPLYWDNYPVNDAEMMNEMHIGPLIGREKDLYKVSGSYRKLHGICPVHQKYPS